MKTLLIWLLLLPSLLLSNDTIKVSFFGKLYRRPDNSAQLIAMLDDKCPLTYIREDSGWIEVQAKGYRGWIEVSQTTYNQEVTAETVLANKNNQVYIISGASVGIALLFILIITLFSKKKNRSSKLRSDLTTSTKVIDHQKESHLNVLVFSNEDRTIKSAHSNLYKRMSTCFREIGFQVHFFESLQPGKMLLPFKVNMIAVDFKLGKNAIQQMEKILNEWGISPSVHIFFYNIPSPDKVKPSKTFVHASYLSSEIDDQDLLKLVAPLLDHEEKKDPNILNGTITGDGAFEIFQLMDVGRRSGTLTITDSNDRTLGVVGFQSGKVSFAKNHRSSGSKAAVELCMLKQGKFTFTTIKDHQANCDIDVNKLLMETAKYEDEMKLNTIQGTKSEENTPAMLAY